MAKMKKSNYLWKCTKKSIDQLSIAMDLHDCSNSDFIKYKIHADQMQLYVPHFTWPSVAMPEIIWKYAKSIPKESSIDEISDAIIDLHNNGAYFKTCIDCGRTLPVGRMESEGFCQACAANLHGYRY